MPFDELISTSEKPVTAVADARVSWTVRAAFDATRDLTRR